MAPKKSGGASASGSDDKSKEKKGGTSIKVTFVTKNIKYWIEILEIQWTFTG